MQETRKQQGWKAHAKTCAYLYKLSILGNDNCTCEKQ